MHYQQIKYKAEFESIFNSISDAIVFTDTKRQILLINPAFTRMFGYQLDEVIGKTTQVIYANFDDFIKQGEARFSETAKNVQQVFDNAYRRKDGLSFPGETLGSHVIDDSGRLIGFLSIIRDMSERFNIQQQLQSQIGEYEISQKLLKESEERFKALHDASFGGIAIHEKGLILDCNQGLSDMTGYANQELIGMNGLKLIAPEHVDRVLRNIVTGYTGRYEVEGVRKDGSVYSLSIKGKNAFYKGREVRVTEFRDITRYKQAEQSLRESEERFRQIFEINPDPVILTKLKDGEIIDVNRAFEVTTGVTRFEALGHTTAELDLWLNKELREPFRDLLRSLGEINNFEADFRVLGGQTRTGLLSARLLALKGEPCTLTVIRDITSEKAAERALIEMDQMKSDFISTAAHELNTPLSAMMGFTELLRTPDAFGGFSEEQKQDFLNEVYERGEALSRIIDDLLDVSRIESGSPVTLNLQETDLAEVLKKTFDFYRLHETNHIFHLDLPEKPVGPMLRIDRHRINQVLENLMSNAVKYSAKGKEITLKGRMTQNGWEVRVEDQGIGMSQGQLDRVFDKFYRADASNTSVSGLGLGMSIAKQIVAVHGGDIRIESVEGKGSTVIFNLPCSAD